MSTTNKATRTARRNRSAELRRLAKAEAAKRQEALDEAIAPAVQRRDVLDGSGAVLRAARVKRDGVAFIRSSPIDHLIARGNAKLERGEAPMFTLAHKLAVDRLAVQWDLVGEGVGLGASDWGSIRGPRSTAPTTPAGHDALLDQVGRRIEVEATAAWLGALWPIVRDVGLKGMSLAAWSAREGMNPTAAAGYLKAALDRLVTMGAQAEPERRPKIRTFGPARVAYSAALAEVP